MGSNGCAKTSTNCYQGEALVVSSYFHHNRVSAALGTDGGCLMAIVNSSVSENLAGGASITISYSYAPVGPILIVRKSLFAKNTGVGINLYGSRASIEQSEFSLNQGTGILVSAATDLTIKSCRFLNNTSAGDQAAGLSLYGLSRSLYVSELSDLFFFGNNGSKWGSAGGIDCWGPYAGSSGRISNIYLDDNFTYLSRGAPNVYAWNGCKAFPGPASCTACSSVASHCILSAQACSCQPGYSGPTCTSGGRSLPDRS